MGAFGSPSQSLTNAFGVFGSTVDKLVGVLEKFPTEVQHRGRFEVQITHDGAEVFATLEPTIQALVERSAAHAVPVALKRRFPDGPVVPRGCRDGVGLPRPG
jgi:hypothetical protein